MKTLRIALGCCLMVLAALGACSTSDGGNGGNGGLVGSDDCVDPCGTGCGGLSASNCCMYCAELLYDDVELEPNSGDGFCTDAGWEVWDALDACIYTGSGGSSLPGCGHVCSRYSYPPPSAECVSCVDTTCSSARDACLAN